MTDSSTASPQLTLLPWTKPLPQAASSWLANLVGWAGEGPLELQDRLVIVPTRQSGRRLREALAMLAAEKNQAVFPPRVIVPEMLPGLVATVPPLASRLEMTLAWTEVLLAMNLRAFRALIPISPPRRDFEWAHALAKRLNQVQSTLGEGGLRMADVAELEDGPERERWWQLAQLEAAVESGLAKQSLSSRVVAEREAEAEAQIPDEFREIIVVGAPDVLPVAVRYLEKMIPQVPITVLVWGPENVALGTAFGRWGDPKPEYWERKAVDLVDFEYQVGLGSNPAAQAREVADLALAHPDPDEWLTVAVGDPEIGPSLEHELTKRNLAVFTPEGKPWRESAFYSVVSGLAALVNDPTADAMGELLRCPDLLDRWAETHDSFSTDTLLRQWDRLRSEHLVPDLMTAKQHAIKWPLLGTILNQLLDWRVTLLTGDFRERAGEVMAEIYQHRSFRTGSGEASAAEYWVESVAAVQRASELLPDLGLGERWNLARQSFGDGVRFENKVPGAVELGGWLELLWADAAQVVIAGCNDGRIPEAVGGDSFLPEGLRVKLGLKSNGERLSRDAYILAAVTGLRSTRNGVRILVGKTSMAGEPLRPSRLLLNGAGADLPDRVRHLFREVGTAHASVPWQRAWTLQPRWKSPKLDVSVTALRDWLSCPFRFYLRRELGMQPQALSKVELDARDFGSLVHLALETVSRDPVLSACGDAERWRAGLEEALERDVSERWGNDLTLPLIIQLQSAKQRLGRAAQIQAEEWQNGWRIARIEWSFEIALGGLTVKGKIDRIDRHQDGRIRVIDYKTSDKPVAPLEAHLGPVKENDLARPDWLRVEVGGKEKRWVDLQLPLYRLALAKEFGEELECCYFNLPKAVSETGLVSWPLGNPELQVAAERCAAGVAASIAAGDFWPPTETLGRRDEDWLGVFHNGTAASVDEDWIKRGSAP